MTLIRATVPPSSDSDDRICPYGLWVLIEEALQRLDAAGVSPADNESWALGYHRYRGRVCPGDNRMLSRVYEGYTESSPATSVEQTARLAGWICALAEGIEAGRWRGLAALLDWGMVSAAGSPYHLVYLPRLSRVTGSPGRAARLLHRIRQRAAQILEPYGIQPARQALIEALQAADSDADRYGQRVRIGRRARRVAARSIEIYLGDEYADPRRPVEWLTLARGLRAWSALTPAAQPGERQHMSGRQRLTLQAVLRGEYGSLREAIADSRRWVENTTDGVTVCLDTRETVHRGRTTATRYAGEAAWHNGWPLGWLVRRGGRTYHTNSVDAADAIEQAHWGWHAQGAARLRARRELRDLPRDRSILIRFADSLAVGNCEPGTTAFCVRHGLDPARLYSVDRILSLDPDNWRVQSAVRVAIDRALEGSK